MKKCKHFFISLISPNSRYALLRNAREFGTQPLDKKNNDQMIVIFLGGEGEIRTRGELPHACFQDKYLKPLGHLSKLQ